MNYNYNLFECEYSGALKHWMCNYWVKNMVLQNYLYLKNVLRYIMQIWFKTLIQLRTNFGYHSNQSCRRGNKNRHAPLTNKYHEFWNRKWPLFLSRLREVLQQWNYLEERIKPFFLSEVSTSLLNKLPNPPLVHIFLTYTQSDQLLPEESVKQGYRTFWWAASYCQKRPYSVPQIDH